MGLDCRRYRLHYGPFDDDAGGRVPPQGDQELARQGDDDRLAHSPTKALDPLVEPQAERRGRLVLQPYPGQLDLCVPQPGVARFGDTLLAIDRAALPWGWRQTGIGGDLPAIIKPTKQALRPEDSGDFGADALQPHQHGWGRGRLVSRRLEQGVAFRRNALQLRQHDLEPIQLADDLRLQVHRQGPAVTGPQVLTWACSRS